MVVGTVETLPSMVSALAIALGCDLANIGKLCKLKPSLRTAVQVKDRKDLPGPALILMGPELKRAPVTVSFLDA